VRKSEIAVFTFSLATDNVRMFDLPNLVQPSKRLLMIRPGAVRRFKRFFQWPLHFD
jgi:hypothetical protein